MINTPHNPTGKVFSMEEMQLIADLCQKYDVVAAVDGAYENIVYDGAVHHSMACLDGMAERTVHISSLGKTFSVTGWKTGYCVAPESLTTELRMVHQYVAFVGVTPVQQALAEFMASEPEYPAGLASFYS